MGDSRRRRGPRRSAPPTRRARTRPVAAKPERRIPERDRRAPEPAAAPVPAAAGAAGTGDEGPVPLRVAVLLVWVEAAALAVLAAVAAVRLATGNASDLTIGALVTAAPLVGAWALWQAGLLLTRRRPVGRGIATVAQIFGLLFAWSMLTGEGGAVLRVAGVLLAGTAVCVVALLTVPSSRGALGLR